MGFFFNSHLLSTIYYLLLYVYYLLSTCICLLSIHYVFNNGMGFQNVKIAPASNSDTWLAPLCFFVLYAPDVVLLLCVVCCVFLFPFAWVKNDRG